MSYDNMGRNWYKSYPYDSSIGEVGEKLDFDGLGRVIQQTKAYRTGSGSCDVSGACAVTHSFLQNCITSTVQRASGDTAATKRCNELFGNTDEQRLLSVTDANGKVWQYSNNAYGNVNAVIAPLSKGNRSYSYDPAKQFLLSETTKESGLTTFGRNAIGQMTTKTDARGVKATYGYNDPLSRLKTITYQNGSPDDVSKDYDNANNVTRIASTNGGTIEYSYDEVNRVYLQKWTYSGKLYTTTYNYDSKGCLYSMTYPTGTIITMTCDSANRVKTISIGSSSIVSNISYHPSGQYNGRIFDSNTGFHDYGARMYWPEIGRFISVDPAEPNASEPTTFNRYAYVLNNPYKYVDPNGRTVTWITGLIGLFVGGAYGAITSYISEEGFNWNAVIQWGGFGAVAGLTLGLGVDAYLAATATVSVAELTATGTAIGIASQLPTNPLVYGPSAGGKLAQLADTLGGETLTDLVKPPELSWIEFSKQVANEAVAAGRSIIFDLTNMQDLEGVLGGTGPYADTITGQELRYFQANWDTFENNVIFMMNNTPTEAPW